MARLGEYRHIMTFKVAVKSDDAAGGYIETYGTLCTCRGSLTRNGGSRVYVDGRDMMSDLYDIETFYRIEFETYINKDSIVVIDNVEYQILNFYRVDEDRRKYRFQCQKVS